MDELSSILHALHNSEDTSVLATLVSVEGSSYRQPGARMLIQPHRRVGSISAGCLEAEICENAFDWVENGPVVKTFETGTANDDLWGWGSGCRGIMNVLLEPARDEVPLLRDLKNCMDRRESVSFATVFRCSNYTGLRVGAKALLRQLHQPQSAFEALLIAHLQSKGKRHQIIQLNKEDCSAQILLENRQPRVRLLVFGEGDSPDALSKLAVLMGWDVLRFGNPRNAHVEECTEWIPLPDWQDWMKQCETDDQTAAVVMTHRFLMDCDIAHGLLNKKLPYVGVMGSRQRSLRLKNELSGHHDNDLSALHCPIGLDVNAETPEEIALSATSEILIALRNTSGTSLRSANVPAQTRSTRIPHSITQLESMHK